MARSACINYSFVIVLYIILQMQQIPLLAYRYSHKSICIISVNRNWLPFGFCQPQQLGETLKDFAGTGTKYKYAKTQLPIIMGNVSHAGRILSSHPVMLRGRLEYKYARHGLSLTSVSHSLSTSLNQPASKSIDSTTNQLNMFKYVSIAMELEGGRWYPHI